MKTKRKLTLVLIEEKDRILLAMKKRGFGEGKWNGFGGKVEEGESIEEAAIRELWEESGLRAEVDHLEKRCEHDFEFKDDPVIMNVHVYALSEFSGEPQETEEMRPKWFHKNDIPYDEMWDDDKYWLQHFLEGKKFNGQFFFEGDTVVEHNLNL